MYVLFHLQVNRRIFTLHIFCKLIDDSIKVLTDSAHEFYTKLKEFIVFQLNDGSLLRKWACVVSGVAGRQACSDCGALKA